MQCCCSANSICPLSPNDVHWWHSPSSSDPTNCRSYQEGRLYPCASKRLNAGVLSGTPSRLSQSPLQQLSNCHFSSWTSTLESSIAPFHHTISHSELTVPILERLQWVTVYVTDRNHRVTSSPASWQDPNSSTCFECSITWTQPEDGHPGQLALDHTTWKYLCVWPATTITVVEY